MTSKKKLEPYLQLQFGTDLYGFIKQKIQVDQLYDYEIASLLKVTQSTISKWRNSYGIKKTDAFTRRFDRRYGKGSIEKFKKMAENPDIKLTEIAKYFGVTKQYVSYVYKKIYGSTYREAVRKKRKIRKKEMLSGDVNNIKF
jgi:predicted XRE-type DNA-binding protein